MSKRQIRVGFTQSYAPAASNRCSKFPTLSASAKCPYPGFCVELLHVIAKQNNLRVVPVVSPLPLGRHDVGRYENGTWQGMLGYVANGTVDTICLLYTDTPVRRQHFDFSKTVFKSNAAFAVGRRKGLEENGLWGMLEPFSATTWLCMLLSMLAVQVTAVIISKAEAAMQMRPAVASMEIVWQLFQLQLRQLCSPIFCTNAGRLNVAIFGLLQCTLLLSLYQGWILSDLIRPSDDTLFKNADELLMLVNTSRVRIVAHDTMHWFDEAINSSDHYYFSALRKALEKRPVKRTGPLLRTLEVVNRNDRYVMPSNVDDIITAVDGFCGIAFIRTDLIQPSARFIFPKGSEFAAMFNKSITMERGLIGSLRRRYYDVHEQKRRHCYDELEEGRLKAPLPLTPVLGVLIVAALGVLLATATFVGELLCAKRGRRRKNHAVVAEYVHA